MYSVLVIMVLEMLDLKTLCVFECNFYMFFSYVF